eukprot:UN32342
MFLVKIGDETVENKGYNHILKTLKDTKKPVECIFADNPSFSLRNSFEVGEALNWKEQQRRLFTERDFRAHLRTFLDSVSFQTFICLIILFDFVLGFYEELDWDEDWVKPVGFALVVLYSIEVLARMYAYTVPVFIGSWLDVFDMLVVLASIIVGIIETDDKAGQGIILLRLVRWMRFIRAASKSIREIKALPAALR